MNTDAPVRALVTGAAGFIGSRLARQLVDRGYHVTLVDRMAAPGRLTGIAGHPAVTYHALDVRDERFGSIVAGHDRVWHLASNTENRADRADRGADLAVTLGGTVALLDALAAEPPEVTVLTSTQLVYGATAGRVDESAPSRPETPFAAAKAAAEAFLCAFAARTGTAARVARLANIVGEGVPRGIVADLADRARSAPDRLTVLGDGRQRRSYLDVGDCVAALLLLGDSTAPGYQVFNVSNDDTLTAVEVAELVAGCRPGGPLPVEVAGGTAWQGDATALEPDAGRLRALGWRPTRSSAEAVQTAAKTLYAQGDERKEQQ